MSTDAEIFNKALLACDELEKQVTSVTGADLTANGKIAALIYAKTREEELRVNTWIFSIKRATATASIVTNNTGWLYAYDVPTDSLRVIGIYDRDTAFADFENDHEGEVYYHFIEEKSVLYCNAPSATPNPFIKYVEKITDPTKFDANFEEALVLRLATKMATAVTGDKSKKNQLGEEYGALLIRARAANALEAEDNSEAEGEPFWHEIRRRHL